MKYLSFLFLIYVPIFCYAAELKPFTTDGCSSFPDGTLNQQTLWLECCIRHDLAYWKGGTFAERKQADQELKLCVSNIGEPEIAEIMQAGVRVGGTPYLPTPYRWGYGWSYLRGYKALTDKDKQSVKYELDRLKLMINSLTEELQ